MLLHLALAFVFVIIYEASSFRYMCSNRHRFNKLKSHFFCFYPTHAPNKNEMQLAVQQLVFITQAHTYAHHVCFSTIICQLLVHITYKLLSSVTLTFLVS